jgi:hypothetical protein
MDTGVVKIYSAEDAPRLRYIAGILLGDLLGLNWEIVTDKRKLGKNPVINYSTEELKGSFRISPSGLLFEKGTKGRNIEITRWKGLPVFFSTDEASDLPFDIFAASFFIVSRYEEYLEFKPDQFGRFPAAESLAHRNGFLHIPVVDIWAKEWTRILIIKFQNLVFRKNKFSSIVTIDVDQPFRYLGKDVFRNIGGLIRDFSNNKGQIGNRYRIVTHGERDPWDVFDYIFEKISSSGLQARFFIPTGDHSAFDKNPVWNNDDFKILVKKIISKFGFGLHPSFHASADEEKLKTEYLRLKKLTSVATGHSRFHFVKFRMPHSLRNLIANGITEDYSMGYPDEPGFRAGISRPFRFYDMERESETALTIFPFQVMDGTLFQYKKLGPDESLGIITDLISETRKAGGTFISIWHNTSLLETVEHKGWRELFESMLKLQAQ